MNFKLFKKEEALLTLIYSNKHFQDLGNYELFEYKNYIDEINKVSIDEKKANYMLKEFKIENYENKSKPEYTHIYKHINYLKNEFLKNNLINKEEIKDYLKYMKLTIKKQELYKNVYEDKNSILNKYMGFYITKLGLIEEILPLIQEYFNELIDEIENIIKLNNNKIPTGVLDISINIMLLTIIVINFKYLYEEVLISETKFTDYLDIEKLKKLFYKIAGLDNLNLKNIKDYKNQYEDPKIQELKQQITELKKNKKNLEKDEYNEDLDRLNNNLKKYQIKTGSLREAEGNFYFVSLLIIDNENTQFKKIYKLDNLFNTLIYNEELVCEIVNVKNDLYGSDAQEIINIVKKNIYFNDIYYNTLTKNKISDKTLFGDLNVSKKYQNIKKKYVKNDPKISQNGGYYKFLNTYKMFDLSRYQIFNEGSDAYIENNKIHCLEYALRILINENENISEEQKNNILQKLRSRIMGKNFRSNKLNTLCVECGIKIKLYAVVFKKDRGYVISGKPKICGENLKNKEKTNHLPIFNICLYNKHYFIYEHVYRTTKALVKNYYEHEEIINETYNYDNFVWKNYYVTKKQKFENKGETQGLTSYQLIKTLEENNAMIPLLDDPNSFRYLEYKDIEKHANIIDTLSSEKEEKVAKRKIKKDLRLFKHVYICDTETFTHIKDIIPYITTFKKFNTCNEVYYTIGDFCIYEMLDKIIKNEQNYLNNKKIKDKKIYMYFHNLKFDFAVMLNNCSEIKIKSDLVKEGNVYQVNFYYKKVEFQLNDSLKLIPLALKEFGRSFNLDVAKDVLPYKLYNEKVNRSNKVSIKKALNLIDNEEDKKQFEENLEKLNLKVGKYHFKAMDYAVYYAKKDIEVLHDGLRDFRKYIFDITNFDLFDFCTISSIAFNYVMANDCYKDVKKVSGTTLNFIQESVYGGYVNSANNKRQKTEIPLLDFDGINLYGSVMHLFNNFIIGDPKKIKNFKNYDDFIKNVKHDHAVFSVKISQHKLSVDKNLIDLPIIPQRTETKINYLYEIPENYTVIIDSIYLNLMINRHGINPENIEIIEGYYWNQGFNENIKDLILNLFNKRVEAKKEKKEGLQLTIKLIMNSIYGKNNLKANNKKFLYVEESELQKIYNNYIVIEIIEMNGIFRVTLANDFNNHSNYGHVGCAILSNAKFLMQKVATCAYEAKKELRIKNPVLFYSDTDSMHCDYRIINKTAEIYKKKYGTELIGKKMGQFRNILGEKLNQSMISIENITIGKKMYIDKIVSEQLCKNIINNSLSYNNDIYLKNLKDNGLYNLEYYYNIKMNFIGDKKIIAYAKKNNIEPIDFYNNIYKGKIIKMNIGKNKNNFILEFNNNKILLKNNKFIHELSYNN